MADTSHGTGGLTFDKSKRSWPNELNILLALVIIIVIFEIIGQVAPYMNGQSFLFDSKDRFDSIFNEARLKIMILQVATIGIIALGVTQVIITGGIDLSSGPLVAATAMIAMSFAQVAEVNGFPEDNRHMEYFSVPEQPDYENHPFRIKLAKSGRTLDVPADKSAADVLVAAGFPIDIKCSDGICGVCKCGLNDGAVEHRDFVLSKAQRETAIITCQSRAAEPGGEIELDL